MLNEKTERLEKTFILKEEVGGTEETHEYLNEGCVWARSKIHRYPSTSGSSNL